MSYHPPGEITPRGILDVGRGCPLRCEFCYYIHGEMKGFEKPEVLKETLDHFASIGKTHYDITGGEPSLCPGIEEVIAYGVEIGLAGRMITSGIYLPKKLTAFLDAGLSDLLLSVHGLGMIHDELVHAPLPKGDSAFRRLQDTMKKLRTVGFSFCVNTVVTGKNTHEGHLQSTVEWALDRHLPIRTWNFIHFNRYYGWTGETDRPIEEGIEVSCADAVDAMIPAIDLLVDRGVAVNVRYMPLCVWPEKYRRHVVGVRSYMLDPSEHDNQGETPESFDARAERLIRQRNTFSHGCFTCSVRPICDGVEGGYAKARGWSEFSPIRVGPSITDPLHYRRDYREAFMMKELGDA